nr:ABC transporter substrate-binding protein [Pontixanthobacter rizhaonensis]
MTIGFLPLVDACLPILAKEHGFAEEEGVDVSFIRDASWATVLDRLLYGHSDAAHLVAPLAIATTLGRGRPAQPISVPFLLGLNGNAITLRPELSATVGTRGQMGAPAAVGERLRKEAVLAAKSGRKLRFGVVHRYSSHNYILRYWLAACGIKPDQDVEIVTVAPPFVVDALGNGALDGVCVGEPYNSYAVDRGLGDIVLTTSQIWRRGVEKVLALREPVMVEKQGAVEALIRAMRKAGAHFIDPANWEENAHILARADYLDGDPKPIQRALSDRLVLSQGQPPEVFSDFMFQHSEAANFPWISQARWLYSQMLRWDSMEYDPSEAEAATRVFRPDIYRSAIRGTGDDLPAANAKVEGSVQAPLGVGAEEGSITLKNNVFFDGRAFDPDELETYVQHDN